MKHFLIYFLIKKDIISNHFANRAVTNDMISIKKDVPIIVTTTSTLSPPSTTTTSTTVATTTTTTTAAGVTTTTIKPVSPSNNTTNIATILTTTTTSSLAKGPNNSSNKLDISFLLKFDSIVLIFILYELVVHFSFF